MPKGSRDNYVHGDWNAMCDGCQFKFKFSELKKDWKGFYKCHICYEPRHILDFQKPPRVSKPIPVTRPDKDGLISTNITYDSGSTSTVPTGTFTTNNETL